MTHFRSIRVKLLLAFLAVITPLIGLQIHFYQTTYNARKGLLLRGETSRSRTIALVMEEYINDLRRQAHVSGISMAENESRWSRRRAEGFLADLYKDNAAIEQIAWTQPDGRVLVAYPSLRKAINVTDRDYYKRIIRGQNWVLSDLLISKVTRQPIMIGAYGVRDDAGRLQGIMLIIVDPSRLSSLFERYTRGEGSTIVVIDGNSRLIYHSRYPKLPWSERRWSQPAGLRETGRRGTAFGFGVKIPKTEDPMLGAHTRIPTMNWSVGAYRPVAAAMIPLSRGLRQSVAIGVCVLVIILVAIIVLGNKLTYPILKLSNAVAAIARGNLGERVSIRTGDEIELLARRFNLMAENLEQVQKISSKLLTDASLKDLVSNLAAGVTAVLGVTRSGVYLTDPATGRIRHAASRGLSENYLRFIDDAPPLVTICDRAASTMKTIVARVGEDEALSAYADVIADEGVGSVVCIPLITGDGKLLGAVAGYFPEGRNPTDEQMSALQFLAGQAAVALENAQLHKETEMRAHEMQVIWEVGQAIALKLDVDDLAATLATRVSSLARADHCCLILYDAESDAFKTLGEAFGEGASCHPDQARLCGGVIREAYISHTSAFGLLDSTGITRVVDKDGAHVLAAPMLLRGQPMGVICLYKHEAGFTESDVRLVSALAGVTAPAIENAMSYGKERRIAETLQSSFLPSSNLSDERVEIAEIYKPALDEANVGGDFFDLMQLPDGRIGVVIADVAGKGLKAAVHTAMVKYMLQAYAFEGRNPAQVLESLNRSVVRHLGVDSFVTLFFGSFDPETGELLYANAGHEMPVLLTPDQDTCLTLDVTGLALGVADDSVYGNRSVTLSAGTILALYTDGLSEARNGSDFFGTEGIGRSLLGCRSNSARGAADCILGDAVEHAQGRLHDDVALVALKYLGRREKRGERR